MKQNLPQIRISKQADELLEKYLEKYLKENGLRQTKTWFVTNCVLKCLKSEPQIDAGESEADFGL